MPPAGRTNGRGIILRSESVKADPDALPSPLTALCSSPKRDTLGAYVTSVRNEAAQQSSGIDVAQRAGSARCGAMRTRAGVVWLAPSFIIGRSWDSSHSTCASQ
jgi:hypothetical protein